MTVVNNSAFGIPFPIAVYPGNLPKSDSEKCPLILKTFDWETGSDQQSVQNHTIRLSKINIFRLFNGWICQ